MQRSWREDADKLTFIICRPETSSSATKISIARGAETDPTEDMVGDINLFLRVDDGDEGDVPPQIVGEIELMIAEKRNQHRGFGKAALLVFMKYITEHQGRLLAEFVAGILDASTADKLRNSHLPSFELSCLSVKIGRTNHRSLALFEWAGFRKVSAEPNFFGEFELRRTELSCKSIDEALAGAGIEEYVEMPYKHAE